MFYYFGYGSNLSVASLRAKGGTPLASEPAVLHNWQLRFNLPDFFPIEGGTGNVQRKAGSDVHGVLHACRDADLAQLDRLEAVGISYERVEQSVVTYSGRRVRAFLYVGRQERLDDSCRPSQRYLNILVRGAKEMRIEPSYISALEETKVCPSPDNATFIPPANSSLISEKELAASTHYAALHGHVFDMSAARESHHYLRSLLAGKDCTLLFLRRMDTSSGNEQKFVDTGELTDSQRSYLNNFLHEFDREYKYAGRMESGARQTPLVGPTRISSRPPPVILAGRRESISLDPGSPEDVPIAPASIAIARAEQRNQVAGNENAGFLSASHGLMPQQQPRLSLSSAYAAWDQIAGELPDLYRSLHLRRRIEELPVLDAGEENLSAGDLLRASSILAILSHAYWYVEPQPPDVLPHALSKPWKVVRQRLDRGPEVINYIDLIVYNWRLLNPSLPDPVCIENMRLLVPTVDNKEERTFYLTQTEILARSGPIVLAMANAQEAVLQDDPESLEAQLLSMHAVLSRIVYGSLLKINPNPRSGSHVDPVVWAKTVAPFAVPFHPDVQGPSGTSSPIFNAMDIFFGRKDHATFLGREIKELRNTYPLAWREYLVSLTEVSIGEYIKRTDSDLLAGAFRETFQVYAGENGFLGRHKMKVYSYIEIAFKVGRSVTIGGFDGMFKDRTWDEIDNALEASRKERVVRLPQPVQEATIKPIVDPTQMTHGVYHLELDVEGTGVRYEPGDRCGILPQNTDRLVERTLLALGASGDEAISLTPEWLEARRSHLDSRGSNTLPARDILRYGRIRPVTLRVAEALHARSQSPILRGTISQLTTEDWELWEILDALRADGFDPRGLWHHARGANDKLSRLIPPERFRMYSISSITGGARIEAAKRLQLTVGRLRYQSKQTDTACEGTASAFLADSDQQRVAFFVQRPPRFQLPSDPRRPVVLLAGGTGVSPFRSFIADRTRSEASLTWLFLGLKSREDFQYADEFTAALEAGGFRLDVTFSRDDVSIRHDPEHGLVTTAGTPCRIEERMLDPDNAERLWDLLLSQSHGGQGANVYICGRSGFAKTVLNSLQRMLERFHAGDAEERELAAKNVLYGLVAEGRLLMEIYSDSAQAENGPIFYHVSDVARHNDETHGYWLIIDGAVYDVTEFINLHPGGARILRAYAGMDASEGFERAHQSRAEIIAMQQMYRIGAVKRLQLGREEAVVSGPSGVRTISPVNVHRAWEHALHLVVEMQNALRADQALQTATSVRGDPESERTPYKTSRSIESHQRFYRSHLDLLLDETLPGLWTLTQGLFAPAADAMWATNRISDLRKSDDGVWCEALARELMVTPANDLPEPKTLVDMLEHLESQDLRLLSDLKIILIAGLSVFEQHGERTTERGARSLMHAGRSTIDVVAGYFSRVCDELRSKKQFELRRTMPPPPIRAAHAPPLRLVTSHLWILEEFTERKLVVLRRMPVALRSLGELSTQNEQILQCRSRAHSQFGLVVDLRNAPVRNDPDFERTMARLRRELVGHFARTAVLLESAIGVLQVNRLNRDDFHYSLATQSESTAIKFAIGER
ncbi:MAG: gamma-glutamylcyclotransferase [Polyangiaceae bacterium]|nr:gamma-glutamylcyclotransferase [Polyangiaceae bacterium]